MCNVKNPNVDFLTLDKLITNWFNIFELNVVQSYYCIIVILLMTDAGGQIFNYLIIYYSNWYVYVYFYLEIKVSLSNKVRFLTCSLSVIYIIIYVVFVVFVRLWYLVHLTARGKNHCIEMRQFYRYSDYSILESFALHIEGWEQKRSKCIYINKEAYRPFLLSTLDIWFFNVKKKVNCPVVSLFHWNVDLCLFPYL